MTTSYDPLKETTETPLATNEQLLKPGDRLGHCRVTELIAAGGMANVYKVWHEQLEVVRAVKILKPGFNEETRGRLETEAKISANLRYINIVEIYGMGYWNQIPYIEMEFVDGPSLKDMLESNVRLPVELAISIIHYVCKALQFAHNQDMTLYGKIYDGLIHRDIKPANILISSQGVIKLADFGIARPSEVSMHTVGSKVMGTFAYLSPEQLNGEKLDQRSDIYSLGAVLYEMVTGCKAFPQKLLAELVQKKAKGHYVPLEMTGIKFPKGFCSAVGKCLSLDRNKRYTDASEFDHDLMIIYKRLAKKPPEEVIQVYLNHPDVMKPIEFRSFRLKKITKSFFKISLTVFIIWLLGNFLFKNVIFHYLERSDSRKAAGITKFDSDSVDNRPDSSLATPRQSEPTKINPFDKAMKAFTESDYLTAALLFEKLSANQLTPKQQKLRNVKLIQSYLKLNRLKKAVSIAESEAGTDALFFLLKGETYYKSGRYDDALTALKQAYTARTVQKGTLKKVSLLEARISEVLYTMKPNRDNKQICHDAWNSFLEKYCSEPNKSAECKEAQEKVSTYFY